MIWQSNGRPKAKGSMMTDDSMGKERVNWPPVREVCLHYNVVMLQPRTGTSPDLGSVDNCYLAILLITALPFSAHHPMSAWGGYPLTPLLSIPC